MSIFKLGFLRDYWELEAEIFSAIGSHPETFISGVFFLKMEIYYVSHNQCESNLKKSKIHRILKKSKNPLNMAHIVDFHF